jgi:hypothetical protein
VRTTLREPETCRQRSRRRLRLAVKRYAIQIGGRGGCGASSNYHSPTHLLTKPRRQSRRLGADTRRPITTHLLTTHHSPFSTAAQPRAPPPRKKNTPARTSEADTRRGPLGYPSGPGKSQSIRIPAPACLPPASPPESKLRRRHELGGGYGIIVLRRPRRREPGRATPASRVRKWARCLPFLRRPGSADRRACRAR